MRGKAISMQAIFVILALVINIMCLQSQNYVSSVLGRYYGSFVRVNSSYQITQFCNPGPLELIINSNCSNCVTITDSTNCGTTSSAWSIHIWNVRVFSDSTMKDTTACSLWCANGKLFPNDSLFIHYKEWTMNSGRQFKGFKVYSTSLKDDLSLPENSMIVSPNPTNQNLYIQTLKNYFIKQNPVMYNALGKRVELEFTNINSHTFYADVSKLSSGVYFIFVQTNEGYLRKKVIIE